MLRSSSPHPKKLLEIKRRQLTPIVLPSPLLSVERPILPYQHRLRNFLQTLQHHLQDWSRLLLCVCYHLFIRRWKRWAMLGLLLLLLFLLCVLLIIFLPPPFGAWLASLLPPPLVQLIQNRFWYAPHATASASDVDGRNIGLVESAFKSWRKCC